MPPLDTAARFTLRANDPAWLTIAAAELGQREVRGSAADNPRIVEYFTACSFRATHDEVPWCSAFVNWVLREAGYAHTRSAAAVSWLRYGMDSFDARRGSIAVVCRRDAAPDPATGSPTGNHVAFLLGHTPKAITLLGGNQGDAVSVADFPRAIYRVRTVRLPRACDRLADRRSA